MSDSAKPTTDWAAYLACPICGAPEGMPCERQRSLPVRKVRKRPHFYRETRAQRAAAVPLRTMPKIEGTNLAVIEDRLRNFGYGGGGNADDVAWLCDRVRELDRIIHESRDVVRVGWWNEQSGPHENTSPLPSESACHRSDKPLWLNRKDLSPDDEPTAKHRE